MVPAAAAQTGTLRGTVTLEATGSPLHKATVRIVQLGLTAETNEAGEYLITGIPPGTYEVSAHMTALTDQRQTVIITAGGTATADFSLRLSPVREQITVTASGREQSEFETFQAVSSLDTLELTARPQPSLGELLDGQPGVAKRSFGPGSSRPVLRGFDGDRVLILKDGIRTGSLSSQSGDHGESFDLLNLERLEVVKGPATLLYGSNAIGGVVNAISRHHEIHTHPHPGLTGSLTGLGGSNNAYGGGGLSFEYGLKNWMFWGASSGQRTGDYSTPIGKVPNSKTRAANGTFGAGYYNERGFFAVSQSIEDARYGVPFAAEFESAEEAALPQGLSSDLTSSFFIGGPPEETVDVDLHRYNTRFSTGYSGLKGFLEGFRVMLDYVNYRHQEIEADLAQGTEQVGTTFDNEQFVYRVIFDQRRVGRLSGQFGFWGMIRDYRTTGAEVLAPPVDQTAFALFTLQEVALSDRLRLQFGGRFEHNGYSPQGPFPQRSFNGFSGAAGVHLPLWKGGAFVANYTHSFRAPALEELYNFGPHIGSLTFEIGNSALDSEKSDGLDLSLRHSSGRIRAEANFFVYGIRDFVFLAPTGNITAGLIEAEYLQSNSRFLGGEVKLDVEWFKNIWFLSGMDVVDAKLTRSVSSRTTGFVTPTNTPLPRIPPLRGRLGVEARFRGFSVRPEVVLAAAQGDIFPTETRTAGYTVVNLNATYTIPQQHLLHVFSLTAFNLNDELYRNHLSFIKDLAPEIGRGVRFSYTVRFF
jgi:iron complex outermembrane receptor protein